MSKIILDIETAPDEKLIPARLELFRSKKRKKSELEFIAEMAIDINWAQIICVCAKESGGQERYIKTPGAKGTEKDALFAFWKWLEQFKQPDIVTFNGKKFDVPILFRRSLINKVMPSVSPNYWDRYPFSSTTHWDLRLILSDGDARAQGSLAFYSKLFLGEELEKEDLFQVEKIEDGPPDADGIVLDFKYEISLASPEKRIKRCWADVVRTDALCKRMQGYFI